MAKTDKAGTIHLLYDSEDDPKYARSSDGALMFGGPISVVGEASRLEGLEYFAWDMAVGKGEIMTTHVALTKSPARGSVPSRGRPAEIRVES